MLKSKRFIGAILIALAMTHVSCGTAEPLWELTVSDYSFQTNRVPVVPQYCALTPFTGDFTLDFIENGDPEAGTPEQLGYITMTDYTVEYETLDATFRAAGVGIPASRYSLSDRIPVGDTLDYSGLILLPTEMKKDLYKLAYDNIGPEAWMLDAQGNPTSTSVEDAIANGTYEMPLWSITVTFNGETSGGSDKRSTKITFPLEMGPITCQ